MPNDTSQPRQFTLPLEFHWPEGMVTHYANQFSIQIFEGVCYLNFFESIPPPITGPPDEVAAQLEKITAIRAEGVARVVVPLPKMQEILNVIQASLGQVVQAGTPGAEKKGAAE